MPYVEARGLQYRYRISGEGPPILMIRGLGRCMDFWLDFEVAMARHFTCICIDNRGVGGTDKPWGPYSTASMADDTAALVRNLGFDRVDLFGISLGGMISQQLLIRHPDLIRRAVLGCTQVGGRTAPKPGPRVLAKLARVLVQSEGDANRMSLSLALSKGYLARHPEIEQRWLTLIRRWPIPRHVFAAQLAAAATHRSARHLPKVTTPTLLITGSADVLIPSSNTERIHQLLPNARIEWIVGAGHDFPTEAPDETTRLIAEFLLR